MTYRKIQRRAQERIKAQLELLLQQDAEVMKRRKRKVARRGYS